MRSRETFSWLLGCALLLVLGVVACTAVQYQAERLDRQIGKANQEQIGFYFGPPDEVHDLPNGETEWVYRYKHTSGPGTGVMGTTTCWKNILRFDEGKVLIEQRREPC